MRAKLTTAFVNSAKAESGAERSVFWDTALPGFGLVVLPNGHKSFVVQYRAQGVSRRATIRFALGLTGARREARKLMGAVASGRDPVSERRKAKGAIANTLKAVTEEYFKREGDKLRSADKRQRAFERLVFPVTGNRQIHDIKRRDIVRLLDGIEDNSGAPQAQQVLAFLSRLFNWFASRDDTFHSPIVRGMARVSSRERARQRILTDDELRAVWTAAEARGDAFGHLVLFLLLTATRLSEAARMIRSEVTGETWVIPAARYKTKVDHVIPLSTRALDVIKALPALGRELVFTNDGKRPMGGFSKFKHQLDEACGVTGWTIHDLRRTARSLMSRAGVDTDIAERCLGHTISGVRGVYDRYAYFDEKQRAFEALKGQIVRILDPQSNIVPLKQVSHEHVIRR